MSKQVGDAVFDISPENSGGSISRFDDDDKGDEV